jgi:translation initiation factor 1
MFPGGATAMPPERRDRTAPVAERKETRLAFSTEHPVSRRRRDPEPEAGPATGTRKARIRLSLDRRASGRLVTVVTGVPGGKPVLAELARELKAACGAGGSVKGEVLELQGDHRDRVEAALATRGLKSVRAGG